MGARQRSDKKPATGAWGALRLGGAITNLAAYAERRQRAIRVLRAAALMLTTFAVGTYGYWFLTDGVYSIIDCLYMTVVTVSTVGYNEIIPPQSDALKVYTMSLIVLGGGSIVYFLSAVAAVVVEGDLAHRFWRKRQKNRLRRLNHHVVLVGLGPEAFETLEELWAERVPLVVVEQDLARLEDAVRAFGDHLLFVHGDPLEDESLTTARVERARAVVVALDRDRESLFAAVNASQLAPSVPLVAMIKRQSNEDKLQRVGADVLVSPARVGGRRLAYELIRPAELAFTDAMMDADPRLQLGTVSVARGSLADGRELRELDIQNRTGALVLGHRVPRARGQAEGHFDYAPGPGAVLQPGSRLVALGRQDELRQLGRMCAPGDRDPTELEPTPAQPAVPRVPEPLVVIGAGVVGSHAVAELLTAGAEQLTVVDRSTEPLGDLRELGGDAVRCVVGDASLESVLEQAGVRSAAGVIVALPADRDNLFVCLSIRQMNPDARVVTRLETEQDRRKFEFIGAHATVNVARYAGIRLAHAVLRPALLNLAADLIASETGAALREIPIAHGSPFSGEQLGAADLRGRTQATVLGLRRKKTSRHVVYRPEPTLTLKPGGAVIALGNEQALDALAALLAAPPEAEQPPRKGSRRWLRSVFRRPRPPETDITGAPR